MAPRPEMVADMTSQLLGVSESSGSASGKISLSSAKKGKLMSHGQGGVGKVQGTLLAEKWEEEPDGQTGVQAQLTIALT